MAAKVPARSSSNFDIEAVRELTHFMKEQGLVEIQLRSNEQEIHLKRASEHAPMAVPFAMPAYSNGNGAHAAPAPAPAPAYANGSADHKVTEHKHHVVKSPFVGTFYRSPGPGKASFADVGKVIDVGDTLCIIEAMKLMNEIESDCRGRVVKVYVQDSTPVEFGEPLFEVEVLR